MPRLNSSDALALLIDSAKNAGFLSRDEETQYATGMPLATVTMHDGTKFNVQLHKILQEADKNDKSDKPEKFRDAYNRVQTRSRKKRAEEPQASPEGSEQTG